MQEILKARFGGSWDGDAEEIHGLLVMGPRKFNVEIMKVEATQKWQCCVFEAGEVLTIKSGDELVELVAQAVAESLR